MNSVVENENIELPLLVKLQIILSPPGTLGSLSKYGKKRILNLQLPNHEKLCGTANSNS